MCLQPFIDQYVCEHKERVRYDAMAHIEYVVELRVYDIYACVRNPEHDEVSRCQH